VDEPEALQKFKSEAWGTESMAASYSQNVNEGSNLAKYNLAQYLKWIGKHLKDGDRILDIGAGTGALTIPISQMGFEIEAFDISLEMMNYISKEDPSIPLWEGDLFEIQDFSKKFDVIVSRWVIPHFSNYPVILFNLKKLLAPGGKIIFDMPNASQFDLVSSWTRYSNLDKNVFGYDHELTTENQNYYSCATDSELKKIALDLGFEVRSRKGFLFFSNNLILATLLGTKNYARYKNFFEKLMNSPMLFQKIFRLIDYSLTVVLPKNLFHSTIVVFEKRN